MSAFVDIDWRGRRVRIEHAFVGAPDAGAPLLVFDGAGADQRVRFTRAADGAPVAP